MIVAFTSQHFTKPFKWLIISLCIKLFLYLIFILPDNSPKRLYVGGFIKSGDHSEYIKPIDNFIERGVYAMNGQNNPSAARLPGFVFPYIIFRAVLSEQHANISLGVFILLLSILSSYALSLLVYHLTAKRWTFILAFLMMNLAPYFWHYDWTLHTSSLGISCLVFFAYFFHNYVVSRLNKFLVYAGFFLAWLLFLRGFCFVYLPVILCALFLVDKRYGKNLKAILLSAFIFMMPFFIFETIWITRNYVSLHKFVPLQTSFVPGADSKNSEYGYQSTTKYSLTKVRELIFSWGGENVWYFSDSDFSWFSWNGGKPSAHKFDETIFYSGLTLDTLNALRNDVLYSYKDSLSAEQHDSIEDKIARTATHLKEKFKSDRKEYYYFHAPLKKLKNYLFRNATQDWPGPSLKESTLIQKAMKYFSLSTYFVLLFQIILFPFLYVKKRKDIAHGYFYLLCYMLVLASIVPFLYLIAMAHYTYFIFGFTLLIPIFVFNVNTLFFNNKK